MMELQQVIEAVKPIAVIQDHGTKIRYLAIDSRKIIVSEECLFIALTGPRFNGHTFLNQVHRAGIRNFMVSEPCELPNSNIITVKDTCVALQQLATYHRQKFELQVLAITGSNGKTIIKEWLGALLRGRYNVVSNPGSFNSQVGVPLSLWNIDASHNFGIFEAGISQKGEMELLQHMISPDLGLFTNLGSAHDEGFVDRSEKLREKLLLFKSCKKIFFCANDDIVKYEFEKAFAHEQLVSWGLAQDSNYTVYTERLKDGAVINVQGQTFKTHFSDDISIENLSHCLVILLELGFEHTAIQKRIGQLPQVGMRLEVKQGIKGSRIIDDTYNNDLSGIRKALEFLSHQAGEKGVVLSDILQSGRTEEENVGDVINILHNQKLESVDLIGAAFIAHRNLIPDHWQVWDSTAQFLSQIEHFNPTGRSILIKGARIYRFEEIVNRLQEKLHETQLEVDLNAIIHNLNWYRTKLKAQTRVMAMVKASAYGGGSTEIASVLEYNKVDYLGVAYIDEGVSLRQAGITIPILVLNPPSNAVGQLMRYDLEAETYSIRHLNSLASNLSAFTGTLKIHLKIDSGMHRLGFEKEELQGAIEILKSNPAIEVVGIMSHLAGADDPSHREFTLQQINTFRESATQVSTALGIEPILHILNSAGIVSFPECQFGMVRLGIGLYGYDSTERFSEELIPAGELKTIISQIRTVRKGESVGYGRSGVAEKDMRIATIAIGYSDGFSRALSNGSGYVLIRGKEARVFGNVCMDMTMVDVTDIEAKAGDEVTVFGTDLRIEQMARQLGTIPYEILTGIGDRVKRVFVYK